MAADEKKDVYSLMIPTVNGNILLPNSNVAEIVPFSNVELFIEGHNKPRWYLGSVHWRGNSIPLVSIDVIQGESDAQANKRSRVAILHSLSTDNSIPYIALVVQGIPRLSHVNPDNIKYIADATLSSAEKMFVSVDGVDAAIPDLEKLEEMILAFRDIA